MDFLRFDEAGKICEHWDAIQQVPVASANPNTMW
jgi:predicted SnoaL-like aldol condensation-catalyzing enzyme